MAIWIRKNVDKPSILAVVTKKSNKSTIPLCIPYYPYMPISPIISSVSSQFDSTFYMVNHRCIPIAKLLGEFPIFSQAIPPDNPDCIPIISHVVMVNHAIPNGWLGAIKMICS
jgi:hypothetical protein